MKRLQAFKFELQPNGDQMRAMRRFAGSCRFVYNKALALQKERYEQDEKKLSYVGLCKLLPEWKAHSETLLLAQTPSQALQQALKNLDQAYSNFFAKRADFPRFKKKGQSDSFRYPQGFKLDQGNNRVFLPKLGWLRYRNSRHVLGLVKNATVSHRAGKWFVSLQTERDVAQPLPQGGAVGIDMGIARFATLSDGSFYAPLNSFKQHEARLRKAQQALSRKTKFSSNWKKAKARAQHIHAGIGDARHDYLHKTSAAISKNHAMVCIEDLKVRNMSGSAAGTSENPGRNVRAKSGLNKAILDQGWFEFGRQLDYKLSWNGGLLIAVPAAYTSQTCPECASVSRSHRKSQAEFACGDCCYQGHADVVGAINVLARAHALLASDNQVNEGQDTVDASTRRQAKSAAARIACEVSGAVRPPAAGTHQSDSKALHLSAVGILDLTAQAAAIG